MLDVQKVISYRWLLDAGFDVLVVIYLQATSYCRERGLDVRQSELGI